MGESVYVDLYFLINFSMDFLCFFLTGKVLERKLNLPRMLLGAAVGGVYANLAIFFQFNKVMSLASDVAVCALMCIIVYGRKKKMREIPLYILVYTAISMTLGGFMTALFYLLNRLGIAAELEGNKDGISVWVFALLAAVSGVITLVGGRFFSARTARKEADVVIAYEGKTVCLHALCDSGNLLREPISGRPCIVVDCSAVKSILPRDVFLAATSSGHRTLDGIGLEHIGRVRLIPTKTVAGDAILLGFRPSSISLDFGKGPRDVDAILALTPTPTPTPLVPSELVM